MDLTHVLLLAVAFLSRERLLEKVERLHADNHKLEHQLTSLEQSALYECTILDDGEGEGWMDGGEEGEVRR